MLTGIRERYGNIRVSQKFSLVLDGKEISIDEDDDDEVVVVDLEAGAVFFFLILPIHIIRKVAKIRFL